MVLKDWLGEVTSFAHSSLKKITSGKLNKYKRIGQLKVDKAFPHDYLGDFLVPYKEFADLHNCRIKIKCKKIRTTMAARPNFLSLLLGRRNRRYLIVVNSRAVFKGVRLQNVPQKARVGLFAHELMHIRDYESRKIRGVIERGIQYLTHKGKIQVEHYTDGLTIAAGFGHQLYHWASYVLHDSDASDEYKAYKEKVYMTPVRILSHIHQQRL